MTVPAVEKGRGAFTVVGKDNASRYYCYLAGKPLDGGRKDVNVNYQAVNLGVKALQVRVNALVTTGEPLVEDGIFGSKTTAKLKIAQTGLGIYSDGIAGPTTCKAMWRDLLIWWGAVYQVPPAHLYGFMMLESVADPGAVGYLTPSDRGLFQINLVAHPLVSEAQAFDPSFSTAYTAKRLSDARAQFAGKGAILQTVASIAQHNSPLAAKQWYTTGSPPNDAIKKYVDLVLGHANQFGPLSA